MLTVVFIGTRCLLKGHVSFHTATVHNSGRIKKGANIEHSLSERRYESKDELKIGRMLDQYGIPFFYKQATIIYNEGKNEIWKPSFTVYPYGDLVIDYVAGSEQGQNDELLRKEHIYRYNQIPAVLLGPKDLTEPNWEDMLYSRIERAYRQEFDPMRYAPEPVEK